MSITTKFNTVRSSSFKSALLKIKPGTVINMSEPMGDFVLPKLIQTPLVFVAGGIGITPFHSILGWLAANGEHRPVKLLYSVNSEDEIIFQETFNRAGVHATIVVANPEASWGGERGLLTPELIMGLEEPSQDSLVYVSGPEPMVEKLSQDLNRGGLKSHQIIVDAFPNYTQI